MSIKNVAVMGAGLAGLTCAQQLKSLGFDVTVFEKSRGVGGRLSTRRVDWASFDHGAQYFTVRAPSFRQWVDGLLAEGTVAQWSPVMRTAPQKNDAWYVACPGMNDLARAQAKGLAIRLNTRVTALARVADQWQLSMEDGTHQSGFDGVVLALPNEQAVPLLAPHQTEWAERLSAVPLQPCWTLMLTTAALDVDYEAGQPISGPIAWWARNDSKPARIQRQGQQDWVVQASATWTAQNLQADKATIIEALQRALLVELDVPSCTVLETAMAHRWLYARRTPGLPAAESSWWSPSLQLGVCGDGLTHSRVEQAYLSGHDMALQIRNTA